MFVKNLTQTILTALIAGAICWRFTDLSPSAPIGPTGTPVPLSQEKTGEINVSGSSAIRVQPNRVVIVFGVATFAKTPSVSQAQNARLSKRVLSTIRAHRIADRDIATAYFAISPRYSDYDFNVISGYETKNKIAVILRDPQNLEPVLIDALEAGATSIEGIEFSITNLRELRDRARDLAIQAALEKATAMATSAGLALGPVTHIQENNVGHFYFGPRSSSRQWTNYQNVVQDMAEQGAITLEDGTISLGQIVVSARVSLTAELWQ